MARTIQIRIPDATNPIYLNLWYSDGVVRLGDYPHDQIGGFEKEAGGYIAYVTLASGDHPYAYITGTWGREIFATQELAARAVAYAYAAGQALGALANLCAEVLADMASAEVAAEAERTEIIAQVEEQEAAEQVVFDETEGEDSQCRIVAVLELMRASSSKDNQPAPQEEEEEEVCHYIDVYYETGCVGCSSQEVIEVWVRANATPEEIHEAKEKEAKEWLFNEITYAWRDATDEQIEEFGQD